MMHLTGTPDEIIDAIALQYPDIRVVMEQIRAHVEPNKRAVAPYQAAVLYALGREHNHPGARVLEIGTAQGYSATVLALAMPDAQITTLNPHGQEADIARHNLAAFGRRITVVEQRSWDYLATYTGAPFDLIFVDGDHKNVRRDLPWRRHLAVGGVMVFHDFSPNGSARPCPPVYRALLEFRTELQAKQADREFDVLVVDDTGVGMAGFVKQNNTDLAHAASDALAVALSYSSASWSYLNGLFSLAERTRDVDGCFVECGCQNGGSAVALAAGLGTDRKVWLFDSFTGVPEPEEVDGEKARLRWESQQPNGWAVGDKATARKALAEVGVKGAKIIVGEFADTFAVEAHKTGAIAVLHLDATLYRSTRAALERFYPLVAEGGMVILSAFNHWQGIRQAVVEYFGQDTPVITPLERGGWFVK